MCKHDVISINRYQSAIFACACLKTTNTTLCKFHANESGMVIFIIFISIQYVKKLNAVASDSSQNLRHKMPPSTGCPEKFSGLSFHILSISCTYYDQVCTEYLTGDWVLRLFLSENQCDIIFLGLPVRIPSSNRILQRKNCLVSEFWRNLAQNWCILPRLMK